MATIKIKTCVQCGDEFTAAGKGPQTLCSDECRRLRGIHHSKKYQQTEAGKASVKRSNAKYAETSAWENTYLEWFE